MLITHSYIVTALESYDVCQRQIRHLAQILPDNWELVFVDDGSNPPIDIPEIRPKFFHIIRTGDARPWTQGVARNVAGLYACGKYFLMTDINHFFTRQTIEACDSFTGEMLMFERAAGNLTEALEIVKLGIPVHAKHPNTFLISRELWEKTGGYRTEDAGAYRPIDTPFLLKCEDLLGGDIPTHLGSRIYVIPEEVETFHGLARR